jgi:hypothetical protein
MNTPIEKLILDLQALQTHYQFIERHGKNLRASDAIAAALKQLHKRLQEEADVIIEAYNAAGGQAGGQKYYEGLYRSGVDELKSYVGYKYEGNSGEGDD